MPGSPREDITTIDITVPEHAKPGDILAFRVHPHSDINASTCEVPKYAKPGESISLHSVPIYPDGEYGPFGVYGLHVMPSPRCHTLGSLLAGFQGIDVACAVPSCLMNPAVWHCNSQPADVCGVHWQDGRAYHLLADRRLRRPATTAW